MPYIYKYTDTNDGLVKYVGMAKSKEALENRIKSHMYGEWFEKGNWKIEYFECGSLCDAHWLEGHFICLYGTGEWYNTQKSRWGTSNFITEVEWKPISDKSLLEKPKPSGRKSEKTGVLENIHRYCKGKGMTISAFEKMCGFGNGVIDDWDRNCPRVSSLLKIEKATGISITEWLERKE